MANAVAPGLLDRYLARTGVSSQLTDEPVDPHKRSNLWKPADEYVDYGAHGDFDDRAHGRSAQVWASQHHALVLAGAAMAAAGAMAVAKLLRRS
jgi:hypothetical protein